MTHEAHTHRDRKKVMMVTGVKTRRRVGALRRGRCMVPKASRVCQDSNCEQGPTKADKGQGPRPRSPLYAADARGSPNTILDYCRYVEGSVTQSGLDREVWRGNRHIWLHSMVTNCTQRLEQRASSICQVPKLSPFFLLIARCQTAPASPTSRSSDRFASRGSFSNNARSVAPVIERRTS